MCKVGFISLLFQDFNLVLDIYCITILFGSLVVSATVNLNLVDKGGAWLTLRDKECSMSEYNTDVLLTTRLFYFLTYTVHYIVII